MYGPIGYSEYVDRVQELSDLVNGEKRNYKTARYYTPDPHFIGKIAEFVYAKLTGQVHKVNMYWIYGRGDGGTDFDNGEDVKGTQSWDYLIVNIGPLRALIYVAVKVIASEEVGFVAGWATPEEVENSEKKDFGYGLRYGIPFCDLHDMSEMGGYISGGSSSSSSRGLSINLMGFILNL